VARVAGDLRFGEVEVHHVSISDALGPKGSAPGRDAPGGTRIGAWNRTS
jgi:hypothetical protein